MQVNSTGAQSQIEKTIGNTPLVQLERLATHYGISAKLYAKLEAANPAGSVKDRVALWMINEAEKSGKLTAGGTIIEPTSGNTGIGLASIGCARGYKVVLTMPETMSKERRSLLAAYGAQLVLTDGAAGMSGALEKAKQLVQQMPGAFMPNQFENKAGVAAHYETTGPEIWQQSGGTVDIFVAGVGTGGTITGTGQFLKKQNSAVQVVAVEPALSPVLSGGKAGPHGLQGIGAGFIPPVLDSTVYNEVIPATEQDAYELSRNMASLEGFLVGISSGAALWAALQLAKRAENAQKNIVALLADRGERYLSTELFNL